MPNAIENHIDRRAELQYLLKKQSQKSTGIPCCNKLAISRACLFHDVRQLREERVTTELSEKYFTIAAALRYPVSGAYGVIALP
jgi:hypothetical protein